MVLKIDLGWQHLDQKPQGRRPSQVDWEASKGRAIPLLSNLSGGEVSGHNKSGLSGPLISTQSRERPFTHDLTHQCTKNDRPGQKPLSYDLLPGTADNHPLRLDHKDPRHIHYNLKIISRPSLLSHCLSAHLSLSHAL